MGDNREAVNNLTISQSNIQFRTSTGHSPDTIGRTPDITDYHFVYNYSCNRVPVISWTKNSTPALVRNRARMLTISSLIFLREMWFGILSLLRIFVGHAPALFASYVRFPASLSPEGGQKGMNGTQEILYQERCEKSRQGKGMDRDGGG